MQDKNVPLPFWEAARREMEQYHFLTDLRVQPQWEIPKQIAIHVAVSGRASEGIAGDEDGKYPQSINDFVEAASSVIAAGATGVHIDFTFVVDKDGRRLDSGDVPMVDAYRMVLEPLRARFGDSFIANLNVLNGKTFDACLEPARAGLADAAPCAAGHPDAFMIPAIRALEECGVKPEIVVHSSGEIELAKRKLIDAGIARKPLNWIVLFGLPFNCGRTLLSGVWVPGSRDLMQHLVLMLDQIREIDPESVITVCAAGRATLYLTTLATMLGVNIRVGIEDTVWRYPNSDEMFSSNLDMFTRALQIADLHGRRPMSATDYRKALGISRRKS
ncbi:MAG: 3-keto-5-aminohexanoate cleavage protein [Pseudomonadota bacterium]|nr:3-keto-5-aminohexanoate cleavage protein [Pseudomonadota bacterium]